MFYRLKIDQECRTRPQESAYNVWNFVDEKFQTIEQVKEKLNDIYGKIPFKKGNKVYIDGEDGDPIHVGYHYSYWEDLYDRSNPGKKYFATDWIHVSEVDETPIVNLEN